MSGQGTALALQEPVPGVGEGREMGTETIGKIQLEV